MSSACSVLQNIETVSQNIADFLGNPSALTPIIVNNLIARIETIRGGVRDLPINTVMKNDILRRLSQAQFILNNGTTGLTVVERILAVLEILQIVSLKIQNLKLPCPPGKVTVYPSNRFSTICNLCN